MNLKDLKFNYGISARKITNLRSNVAIVESDENKKFIIKRVRRSNKTNWINKHRFKNELRIYKQLSSSDFKILNTPDVIAYSNEHMILQFIDKNPESKTKIYEFVCAYFEMQTINVPVNFWFDLKNQLIRGFLYKGIIIPLFTLVKHLPVSTVLKMILVYLRLELSINKLSKKFWLHGDLTNQNVYHNLKDGKLYFLDFENLFYTKKWPLIEIIQKCIWLKEGGYAFQVDIKALKYYLEIAKEHGITDFNIIDFKKQFQFALLMNCINSIAIAKSKIKRGSFTELLDIIIDKQKYQNWYSEFIKPQLIEKNLIQ